MILAAKITSPAQLLPFVSSVRYILFNTCLYNHRGRFSLFVYTKGFALDDTSLSTLKSIFSSLKIACEIKLISFNKLVRILLLYGRSRSLYYLFPSAHLILDTFFLFIPRNGYTFGEGIGYKSFIPSWVSFSPLKLLLSRCVPRTYTHLTPLLSDNDLLLSQNDDLFTSYSATLRAFACQVESLNIFQKLDPCTNYTVVILSALYEPNGRISFEDELSLYVSAFQKFKSTNLILMFHPRHTSCFKSLLCEELRLQGFEYTLLSDIFVGTLLFLPPELIISSLLAKPSFSGTVVLLFQQSAILLSLLGFHDALNIGFSINDVRKFFSADHIDERLNYQSNLKKLAYKYSNISHLFRFS